MKIRFTHSMLTVLFLSICCFLPRAGEAQAGSITGTVVDDDGAAVSNVRVAVYAADDDTVIIADNRTDAAGGYGVTGLDNGDYKVWFLPDGDYIAEWYDGSPDFSGAQPVSVTSGTPDVDLGETRLVLGGKITGTVTYSDTPPSADVYVQAYDSGGAWVKTAQVDSSTGGYTLRGLPAGTYTVFFWAFYTEYISEWYNDTLSKSTATSVSLTAGGTISNIDAELALGGEIVGTVRDSDGNPIKGALVLVYDINDSETLRGFSSTSGTDLYTVTGLPESGSFKVQFCERQEADGSCGGLTEWYNNKRSFYTADIVTTGDTGVDAVLEPHFNWLIFTPVLTHRPTL